MGRFEDKVAFITGASSGIGASIGRAFIAAGARVVLLARRVDRLEALASELGADRVLVQAADVTSEAALERAVAATVERFGRLDVVVANAGFAVAGGIDRLTVDDFRRQFDTNVFGVVATIRAAHEALRQSKGQVVLISSVVGRVAVPRMSAYVASKHAVSGLALALRPELHAEGIGVTLVCPGFVKSEIQMVDNRGVFHAGSKNTQPRLAADADACARAIVRAAAARKRELDWPGHAKAIVFLGTNFPGVWDHVMRRQPKRKRASGDDA